MTAEELLEKIQVDLEALTPQHLCDFEVYILDQFGDLPDERVILNLVSAPEEGRGISAAVGEFEEPITVEMRAEFPAANTLENRQKAFSILEQLKAYVRANRLLTAGGNTTRYATYTDQEIGTDTEGGGETQERVIRYVRLVALWRTVGG